MGFRYSSRSLKVVDDLATKFKRLSETLTTVSQQMRSTGLDEIHLAFSKGSMKAIEDLVANAGLSVVMVERQLQAKLDNNPNPYAENTEKAESEKERKKSLKNGSPSKPRGRPKKNGA